MHTVLVINNIADLKLVPNQLNGIKFLKESAGVKIKYWKNQPEKSHEYVMNEELFLNCTLIGHVTDWLMLAVVRTWEIFGRGICWDVVIYESIFFLHRPEFRGTNSNFRPAVSWSTRTRDHYPRKTVQSVFLSSSL